MPSFDDIQKYVTLELSVIKDAPVTFLVTIIIVWACLRYLMKEQFASYKSQIDSLNGQLSLKNATIEHLEKGNHVSAAHERLKDVAIAAQMETQNASSPDQSDALAFLVEKQSMKDTFLDLTQTGDGMTWYWSPLAEGLGFTILNNNDIDKQASIVTLYNKGFVSEIKPTETGQFQYLPSQKALNVRRAYNDLPSTLSAAMKSKSFEQNTTGHTTIRDGSIVSYTTNVSTLSHSEPTPKREAQ